MPDRNGAPLLQRWIVKPYTMPCRLGDVQLFSWTAPCAVLAVHFSDLPDDPSDTTPPFATLGSQVIGAVVRSHPIRATLPRVAVFDEFIRYVPQEYDRCCIDLRGTFEDYLRGFSAKTRSTLTRKVRKFAESSGGRPEVREYQSRDEITEFYRIARNVSKKTYQERLLHAGLPQDVAFERSMLDLATAANVRAYLLFYREEPIAYLYLPIVDGVVNYQYLGYDPAFAAHSPGTVLLFHALARLFAESRFRMFDFLEGEGQHKRIFATTTTRCADIYYYRRGLRPQAFVAIHSALDRIATTVGALLSRYNLKSRVRRLLRGTGPTSTEDSRPSKIG